MIHSRLRLLPPPQNPKVYFYSQRSFRGLSFTLVACPVSRLCTCYGGIVAQRGLLICFSGFDRRKTRAGNGVSRWLGAYFLLEEPTRAVKAESAAFMYHHRSKQRWACLALFLGYQRLRWSFGISQVEGGYGSGA